MFATIAAGALDVVSGILNFGSWGSALNLGVSVGAGLTAKNVAKNAIEVLDHAGAAAKNVAEAAKACKEAKKEGVSQEDIDAMAAKMADDAADAAKEKAEAAEKKVEEAVDAAADTVKKTAKKAAATKAEKTESKEPAADATKA